MTSARRVIAAAVLGLSLASCAGSATPTTPSPPRPTSSPAPTSTPVPLMGTRMLPAGTYRVGNLLPLLVTVTVPAGWDALDNWALLNHPNGGLTALAFYRVVNLYADPCHWSDNELDPPVGATVNDLARAMGTFSDRQPSPPQPDTIGGADGWVVEWSVPSDAVFAECDEGQYRSWTKSNWMATDFGARFHQGPGQIDRVHMLDVGGTRLVVDQAWQLGATDAELTELQAIVDSIEIVEPAP